MMMKTVIFISVKFARHPPPPKLILFGKRYLALLQLCIYKI